MRNFHEEVVAKGECECYWSHVPHLVGERAVRRWGFVAEPGKTTKAETPLLSAVRTLSSF